MLTKHDMRLILHELCGFSHCICVLLEIDIQSSRFSRPLSICTHHCYQAPIYSFHMMSLTVLFVRQ